MSNLIKALMTLLTNIFTLEDIEEGLKEAATPLRTFLFNKTVSASLNDDEEDDVNEEIVSNILDNDGGNIHEERSVGYLALSNGGKA